MTDQELQRNFRDIFSNQKKIFDAIKTLQRDIVDIDRKLTYGNYKAGK